MMYEREFIYFESKELISFQELEKNQLISLTCWTNISREEDVEEISVD